MALQRDDLRLELRDELKTDPNGKIWRDRELNRFLSRAYIKIQSDCHYSLPENEVAVSNITTVASTQEYTLPIDFGKLLNVRDVNSGHLAQITKQELLQAITGTSATNLGQPSRYYLRGLKIGFYPIPDSVRTIELLYNAFLAFPTDDVTDISYGDDEIEGVIIKYASYLAWSSPRGNRNEALARLQDYELLINSIKNRFLFQDRNIQYQTVRNTDSFYNPRGLNA